VPADVVLVALGVTALTVAGAWRGAVDVVETAIVCDPGLTNAVNISAEVFHFDQGVCLWKVGS
jgi:hypothetical protein